MWMTPQQQALFSASTVAYRFLGEEANFWHHSRCKTLDKINAAQMDMFKLRLIANEEDMKKCKTIFCVWIPEMAFKRHIETCFRCPPRSRKAVKEACNARKEEFIRMVTAIRRAIRLLAISLSQ